MTEPPSTQRATRDAWELTAALRHFGWERSGGVQGRFELWRDRAPSGTETLVPVDPSKGDFRALLRRARTVLVETAGREAERYFESLADASRARLDRTQFKKDSPLEHGLILWEQGDALFQVARGTLVAAAKARKSPRRYHGNASSFLAKQYLESAIMGQTEIGSFVVTAYLPANETFHVSKADADRADHGEPALLTLRGREITEQLASAVLGTRAALDEYRRSPDMAVFGESVDTGVSYELVTALSVLSRDSAESAVTISFTSEQSPSREVEVVFNPTDVPVLERAALFLAADRPPEHVVVHGYVTLLDRPRPGEPGVIRLQVTSGSDARVVRVRLESEDYRKALEAHQRNAELTVSGRLEREGHYYWLYDTGGIRVAGADDPPAPRLFD